jgi:hypothetical protein
MDELLKHNSVYVLLHLTFTSYIRAVCLCGTRIALTDFVIQVILVTTTSYKTPCYAVFSITLFLTLSSRNTALSQTHSVSVLPVRRQNSFTFDVNERGKLKRYIFYNLIP